MRQMDDFLYLTASAPHATAFAQAMHEGFPEFGVFVNPDKTRANLSVPRVASAHSQQSSSQSQGALSGLSASAASSYLVQSPFESQPSQPAPPAVPVSTLAWNGLVIDPRTLHVHADYTRLANTCARLCLTWLLTDRKSTRLNSSHT